MRVRGSWRPNITEIFWSQSYGRQCCVFLVLHGCSTGALAFLTTSRPLFDSNYTACPQLYSPVSFCSIRRPYITFKLPRGNMDTPPRLRNFFRYLATGMCHFRYLWNGLCDHHQLSWTSEVTLFRCVSLWEYNGIFFYLVPFHQPISAHAISSHNRH